MKLALRYGMIITVGLMAWIIIAHTVVPNPQSLVHSLGAFTFFNLLHFAMIYLGITALEREKNEKPTFKEGLKQGVSISFVYAVTAALFFVGVLLFIGPKWMAGEAARPDMPMWLVGVQAFAGFIALTMIFGLVYSTLISFFLAKRLSRED
jgi:hypothetical protein